MSSGTYLCPWRSPPVPFAVPCDIPVPGDIPLVPVDIPFVLSLLTSLRSPDDISSNGDIFGDIEKSPGEFGESNNKSLFLKMCWGF
jgi:hypothetical protein